MADWKGVERDNETRWLLATRVVGFSMLGVAVSGSLVALLIGRPDLAINGVVLAVLGLIFVVVDAAARARRRPSR